MKKVARILLTSIALILISGQTFAADLKIGIVNLNAVLQQAPLMISLNNDLIKRFQSRQNDLIAAQKQLQDETNKLNIAGNMSADDQNKLKTKIATDQANFQILSANLQKDLAIAKDAAMQKFTAKINSVIQGIAKSGNYDVIEQSSNFLFIKPELDITQQVVSQMK